MSLVDLEDVPEAKSSRSTSPTRRPRVTASSATPEPVAPPPITSMSSGLAELAPISAEAWVARDGTTTLGSVILCRIADMCAPASPRSLAENVGPKSRIPPPAAAAIAAAPIRRLRRALAAIRCVWSEGAREIEREGWCDRDLIRQ